MDEPERRRLRVEDAHIARYDPRSPALNYLVVGIVLTYAYVQIRSLANASSPPSLSNGRTAAEATIESWRGKPGNVAIVTYRYQVSGATYEGYYRATKSQADSLTSGERIPIEYINARPAQSFLKSASSSARANPTGSSRIRFLLDLGWWGLAVNTAYLLYKGWRFGFNRAKTWLW